MSDTVKDSTPTAVTVSDRMREQRLIKDPFDFVAQLATECGFSIQQWELSDTVKLTGLYRHVVKRVLTHHDPAEERLDCQTCDGSGQIEVGTERPHDGGEVSVYDDCPDCADKPASLPQTLGEEIPAAITYAVDRARERLVDPSANVAMRPRDIALVWTYDSRSRLLTALEEKEKERGEAIRVADEAAKAVERLRAAHEEKDKQWNDIAQVALDRLYRIHELQSASVLQKEELQAKIDHLRAAGNQLSNIAFNLAQPEVTLTDNRRATLKRCQEDWDNARSA